MFILVKSTNFRKFLKNQKKLKKSQKKVQNF